VMAVDRHSCRSWCGWRRRKAGDVATADKAGWSEDSAWRRSQSADLQNTLATWDPGRTHIGWTGSGAGESCFSSPAGQRLQNLGSLRRVAGCMAPISSVSSFLAYGLVFDRHQGMATWRICLRSFRQAMSGLKSLSLVLWTPLTCWRVVQKPRSMVARQNMTLAGVPGHKKKRRDEPPLKPVMNWSRSNERQKPMLR